ncbi:MAG: thiamine pyrophosphate-dependent dehydrogenase E1 component subunit alpha [Actinomycetota bacterium]
MATEVTEQQGEGEVAGGAPSKNEQLKDILYRLRLCRYFDERMEALYRQGRLPGAIYSGRGQEGTHVGAAYALRPDDALLVTHRDLSAQLTKGLDLKRVMAQFWGRIDGYTRGRDGNSHIGDWYGNKTFTVLSMLPDGYPVACGMALAYKRRGEPHIALAICGEGSTSNGRWHESLNVSAIHKLPVVWVVNNNQWAYSTPNRLEFDVPTIAERSAAYGMPGRRVDGADVLEVYGAVSKAVERARAGDGPTLIESVSLRWRGHAGHDAATYVPRDMMDEYTQHKDPVKRFEEFLLAKGIVDAGGANEIQERVEREFTEAYEYAQRSPFPVPEDVPKGVFTDDGYWQSEPSREGGTG